MSDSALSDATHTPHVLRCWPNLLCSSHLNLMPEQTIMLQKNSFSPASSQAPDHLSCKMATSKFSSKVNVNVTLYVSTFSQIKGCRCEFLQQWLNWNYCCLQLSLVFKATVQGKIIACHDILTIYASLSVCYISHGWARFVDCLKISKLCLHQLNVLQKPFHCVQ